MYLCICKLALLFPIHKLTIELNILNCSCSVCGNMQQWLLLWESKRVTERRGRLCLSSPSRTIPLIYDVTLSVKPPLEQELGTGTKNGLYSGMQLFTCSLHRQWKENVYVYCMHRTKSGRTLVVSFLFCLTAYYASSVYCLQGFMMNS